MDIIKTHKSYIKKINDIVKNGLTRYSMSNNSEYFSEDNNDCPHWCFGITEILEFESPLEWCFAESTEKSIQLQAINCFICGGYISNLNGKNPDNSRLIKNLYCDIVEHHNMSYKIDNILRIKELLKLYDKTKDKYYLYKASLKTIIVIDNRIEIFKHKISEYIGIYLY